MDAVLEHFTTALECYDRSVRIPALCILHPSCSDVGGVPILKVAFGSCIVAVVASFLAILTVLLIANPSWFVLFGCVCVYACILFQSMMDTTEEVGAQLS